MKYVNLLTVGLEAAIGQRVASGSLRGGHDSAREQEVNVRNLPIGIRTTTGIAKLKISDAKKGVYLKWYMRFQ